MRRSLNQVKRDRRTKTYYELCDVAFQNRVKKKGDWQCQLLALRLVPVPAPANRSSVALRGKLIVLLSDYVCLLACFFGNTVNTTEWCMTILSLTSSQVTAMLLREERRNSEKGEVQDVDESKHTQSR